MKEYLEFNIPNNTVVEVDWEKGPTYFNRICIEKEIDIQDFDYSSHFCSYPKLEEFVVLDKESTFFTHQGCLYKRYIPLEIDPNTSIYEVCGDIPRNQQDGCILICCPQSNPIKDIVLPDDCFSIAGGAFYNCNLNSIRLPDSLYSSAIAAFKDLKVNTIYVPDKYGCFEPDHNNVSEDVKILSNNPKTPKLSSEMELYWMCILNEEVWDKNIDMIHNLRSQGWNTYEEEFEQELPY